MTIVISATELKKNTADVINRVRYERTGIVIERHGEPVAKIVPLENTRESEAVEANIKKYFGAIPDFPDMKKYRRLSKNRPSL